MKRSKVETSALLFCFILLYGLNDVLSAGKCNFDRSLLQVKSPLFGEGCRGCSRLIVTDSATSQCFPKVVRRMNDVWNRVFLRCQHNPFHLPNRFSWCVKPCLYHRRKHCIRSCSQSFWSRCSCCHKCRDDHHLPSVLNDWSLLYKGKPWLPPLQSHPNMTCMPTPQAWRRRAWGLSVARQLPTKLLSEWRKVWVR